MNRRVRLGLFAVAAAVLGVVFVIASGQLPHFGSAHHPYRDLAVAAAVRHSTANVVTFINFDGRGIDTLIEETMLIASVLGAAVLLRPAQNEEERAVPRTGRVLSSTRLIGYVLLPVTIVVGLDVVLHGALTPGGGFQGGVVLGTGIHLLYVAGDFPALERIRPLARYHLTEGFGGVAYVLLGLLGLFAGTQFMTNIVPQGHFGDFYSAGLVSIINGVVGVEVVAGVIVLLASFLDQEIMVRPRDGDTADQSAERS